MFHQIIYFHQHHNHKFHISLFKCCFSSFKLDGSRDINLKFQFAWSLSPLREPIFLQWASMGYTLTWFYPLSCLHQYPMANLILWQTQSWYCFHGHPEWLLLWVVELESHLYSSFPSRIFALLLDWRQINGPLR